MKKKIIGLVTVMMLILPVFGSFATAENTSLKPIDEIAIENYDFKSNSNTMINFGSTTEISTIGPVSPMLNIAEIIIIAGPYFRTFIIRLLLVSMKA